MRPRISSNSPRACTSSSRSWACAHWDPRCRSPRAHHRALRGRLAGRLGGRELARPVDARQEANAIGGSHGLGMSDQIENRIIEAKSRGSTRRPAWRSCTSPTSGSSMRSTTRPRSSLPRLRAAGSAGCSTRAAGSIRRRSCCARACSAGWRASSPARSPLELRRGDDYSILDTTGPHLTYQPERLSMERSEGAAFGPLDRIGQLTMRDLDIQDSRAKLEQYAERRLLTPETDALGLLPARRVRVALRACHTTSPSLTASPHCTPRSSRIASTRSATATR